MDPSPRLQNLLAYLLESDNITPNPKPHNPNAKHLPFHQHNAFCMLHQNEAIHIPDGVRQGWPTSPNWVELEKRMGRDMSEYVWDVITGKKGGSFFELAKKEWETKGPNKMRNSFNEFGSIHIEQPG